jgi:addiction module HigA family antidote
MTLFLIPIPTNRPPTTPGEVITEEFLKPLDITQQALADAVKMSRVGVNAILNGRRAITPHTALRLERVLGPSAQFWLNLQMIVEGRLRSG